MPSTRANYKKITISWRSVWAPMLFIALGLHALLLFAPLQSQKQNSEEEGESVQLTRLTTVKPPEKQTPEKKPEPQRVASQSSLVVKASPSLSPSPPPSQPKASPSPVAKREAPKAQPSSTAPSSTVPPQVSNASPAGQAPKLTQEEQVFVKRLQGLEGREVTDPVSSTLFPNPEYFYKDPIKELGKPGVVGVEYISFQKPEDVYNQLVKLYSDYTITPKPEYADSAVYQFKKGNFVRYVSLVRAQLGAGTLIVLWNREPG